MEAAGTSNLAHEKISALKRGVIFDHGIKATLGLRGVGKAKIALTQPAPSLDKCGATKLGGTTQVLFGTLAAGLIEKDGTEKIIDILALAVNLDDRLAEVDGLADTVLLIKNSSEAPTSLDVEGVESQRLTVANGRTVVAVAAVVTHTTGNQSVSGVLRMKGN